MIRACELGGLIHSDVSSALFSSSCNVRHSLAHAAISRSIA